MLSTACPFIQMNDNMPQYLATNGTSALMMAADRQDVDDEWPRTHHPSRMLHTLSTDSEYVPQTTVYVLYVIVHLL